MFWQGANVIVSPSKVVPETLQSDLFGVFFGSLGRRWGHLGAPVAPQSPFKKFSKINRIFGDFWVPPGGGCHCRRPGLPGSKKRTFSPKVAISLQRGANFQILDFGTPLEKSVSLTFSEQWLCHFSKDSGGVFPVGAHGLVETTRHSRARRHGGGYMYLLIF